MGWTFRHPEGLVVADLRAPDGRLLGYVEWSRAHRGPVCAEVPETGASRSFEAISEAIRFVEAQIEGATGRGGSMSRPASEHVPDYLVIRDCSCGAHPGDLHIEGCDIERCPRCGMQASTCDCVYVVAGLDPLTMEEERPDIWHNGPTEAMRAAFDAKHPRARWTGLYPGTTECVERGWYSRWDDGAGWVDCDKDQPDASPAYNRWAQWRAAQGVWR